LERLPHRLRLVGLPAARLSRLDPLALPAPPVLLARLVRCMPPYRQHRTPPSGRPLRSRQPHRTPLHRLCRWLLRQPFRPQHAPPHQPHLHQPRRAPPPLASRSTPHHLQHRALPLASPLRRAPPPASRPPPQRLQLLRRVQHAPPDRSPIRAPSPVSRVPQGSRRRQPPSPPSRAPPPGPPEPPEPPAPPGLPHQPRRTPPRRWLRHQPFRPRHTPQQWPPRRTLPHRPLLDLRRAAPSADPAADPGQVTG
jgi:hypothetical protein